MDAHQEKSSNSTKRAFVPWKFIAILSCIMLLYLIAWATDTTAYFEGERLRALVLGAGVWGGVLFVVAFVVGQMIQIPGVVFVGVSVFVWGQWYGCLVSFIAALMAVSATFWTIRLAGHVESSSVNNKWAKKILEHVEQRPILMVALLRVLLFLTPVVNIALAISPVRYRDYIIGSALGLVLPFIVAGLFFNYLFH